MSMDGWYGPAIDNHAPKDGGSHFGPVTIGVLHTTEGEFSPRVGDYFGHSSYPHFTCDVDDGVFRCYQHISIRRAARALKNRTGGCQTNREGVVQIEVVGSATRPFTHDPVMVLGLVALMRWIESQTKIPATSSVPWMAYPASYGNSSVRMSSAEWERYAGWCGHQHVPENDHGDPGAINFSLLLPTPLPPVKPPPVKPPIKEDIVFMELRRGASGQHVKNLQGLLVANGHKLDVDGVFGPGTEAAVLRHKLAWKLPNPRQADRACWRTLLRMPL